MDEGPTAPSEATTTEEGTTITVTVVEWDNEPLVAVTLRVYMPIVDEDIVSVDVPDPPEVRGTLVGFREAVRPEGETNEESDSVPEKPLRLTKLMIDVPEEPD